MTVQTSISAEDVADRLAIRQLVDAYAHCADRRDAKGQMALFTPDTVFEVFMDSRSAEPRKRCAAAMLSPRCSKISTPIRQRPTSTAKAP
jgi:hypothetical protein